MSELHMLMFKTQWMKGELQPIAQQSCCINQRITVQKKPAYNKDTVANNSLIKTKKQQQILTLRYLCSKIQNLQQDSK